MYQASSEFHTAVANGKPQIALLMFNNAVFSNEDINVSAGIEFHDYFCAEEDLTIGKALSNEISFSLFNDNGYLNDYEFGDFRAEIGVLTLEGPYSSGYTFMVQSAAGHRYTYFRNTLTFDGSYISTQPQRTVTGIVIYGTMVYCLLDNDSICAYSEEEGTPVPVAHNLNAFMMTKLLKYAGKAFSYGRFTGKINNELHVWIPPRNGAQGIYREYEFVPLGYFTAERPNVPYVNEIHFTCYDFMQKFERDMPSDADLGISYPCVFGTLFVQMCNYAGVDLESFQFINSTAEISARPDAFNNATMRDVLQWLAEAAGSVARFNRDGQLKMDWLRTTNQVFDETKYSEYNPYWYETKKVTKLYNRASNGEYENTRGSGSEAYLIQDNPLLKGVT